VCNGGKLLYTQLQFETSRFRLLHYEMRYDPHLLPGVDVAHWLGEHLKSLDCQVSAPRRSGDAWVIEVEVTDNAYLIGVRVRPLHESNAGNLAVWCVVIEKQRTLLQRLLLRNDLAPDDMLCSCLFDLLKRQMDFRKINKTRYLLAP